MAAKPYYTSNNLIEAVKRKASIPLSQVTFTENDILAFANEEMMMSQVPMMLAYHEEYYVYNEEVVLEANKDRYPIPARAIGMRLRDVKYKDNNGNLYDMTRIDPSNRELFQGITYPVNVLAAYYLENTDLVLPHVRPQTSTGTISFSYFLRPNQLVLDERAAIINDFSKEITVDNALLVAGTLLNVGNITFTAVVGAPGTNEYQIGASSTDTATNLANAINTNGTYSATSMVAVVSLSYEEVDLSITTPNENNGISISTNIEINFTANIDTDVFANDDLIDFLQTGSGHKTYGIDREIPLNGISGATITFSDSEVPDGVHSGDYICLAQECIIPQLPDDLHNGLAERVVARLLEALGDREGLGVVNDKIQDIDKRTGNLIDQRVDSDCQKILNKYSLLRLGKSGINRGY